MVESVASHLGPWSNFYIMIGSAAASLTGLMFVVITLVNGAERVNSSSAGISTFSTPTVVHFCAVLLVAGVLSAPWRALSQPAIVLAIAGAIGIAYMLRLILMTKRIVEDYEADIEDWVWYNVMPLLAYAALLCASVLLTWHPFEALFVLAATAALLIFIGIHNSWDIVTYLAVRRSGDSDE